MDKFIYTEPQIEEIEIAVEQGFADSIVEDPEQGDDIII